VSLIDAFKKARRVSTPIIAITSADQEATIKSLIPILKEEVPAVKYDVAQGPTSLNEAGRKAVLAMVDGDEAMCGLLGEDPARAMIAAYKLPEDSVLFFLNAQRQANDARTAQAIALMREKFKPTGRTIVLLAPQITLPEQIAGDTMILDDPLPGPDEIKKLLDKTYTNARQACKDLPEPTEEIERKAVESVRGLHAAAIDQTFAYSMEPTGIDISCCWLQKRNRVEQTRGLTFYQGGESYDDIGGLMAFKEFMRELYEGPEPFRLIIWLDEIEKVIGSSDYDGDGGVGRDQLGCILSNMEDNGWTGAIAVGPPGAGKSFIAKATGNSFGVPCIRMDLGAVKGSLVGESEQLVRQMLKVVLGIADSDAFFIATCNNLTNLPPELKRRFSLGRTWFFDLPDEEEKDTIWKINRERFGIDPECARPADDLWTGSDIRDCCKAAYRRRKTLAQVASQIIPIARQEPRRIESLRKMANKRFLSASYEGPYIYKDAIPQQTEVIVIPNQSVDRKTRFN
jgi:hypothetical protein